MRTQGAALLLTNDLRFARIIGSEDVLQDDLV